MQLAERKMNYGDHWLLSVARDIVQSTQYACAVTMYHALKAASAPCAPEKYLLHEVI